MKLTKQLLWLATASLFAQGTTPDMLLNLDDALRGLGLALDYEVVNLGKLAASDPRTGYPTPTVLYRNRDLFDMPAPVPPYPEPS